MKDRARVGNHPVHPMLIPFPIGLWIFSLVSDIIYHAGGNASWATVAFYSMAGGIIGAIVASVPGFLDFFGLRDAHIRKTALWHMILNVSALILFIVSFFLRMGAMTAIVPFILSIIGVLAILASGWLGGHMVYVQGMAVDETEICHPGDRALHRARS